MEKELLLGLMEKKKQEYGKMESYKNKCQKKDYIYKIKRVTETIKQVKLACHNEH